MFTSTNLQLPYVASAQAQKHVTHNEALRMLDAVVHLSVIRRDETSPPQAPEEGDRYIIAAAATDAWTGHDGMVVAWQDATWEYFSPQTGWLAWIADEDALLAWNGNAWQAVTGGSSVNPTALVGVNATADTTNRLSVSSAASLFNHEGAGHQQKINKASSQDTASQLFQSDFSGRGEIGLTGDDDFHLKVSPDGTTFHEAMVVDRHTGSVALPNTVPLTGQSNLLINGDFQINQRVFANGTLTTGSYGYDRWKAGSGGADLTVSGENVTLTSGAIEQVLELPRLGAEAVTLSVEDLTGNELTVSIAGETRTIAPGGGRRSATIALPASATGNIVVSLAASSGTTTFRRVKLERGENATPWSARTWANELAACQRFYCKSFSYNEAPAPTVAAHGAYASFAWHPENLSTQQIVFPQQMRAVPTVTLYPQHSASAPIGQWQALVGAFQNVDASIDRVSEREFMVRLQKSALGATIAGGYFAYGLFTAEAEL